MGSTIAEGWPNFNSVTGFPLVDRVRLTQKA